MVLDCCFSGEAVKEFQFDATGAGRLVEGQVYEAMPATGWAVLTASSASMPAIAPKGEDLTMFTGALTSVLSNTSDGSPSRLTLSDLIAEANQVIRRKHGLKAVTPQCHVPRQDSGDVSRIPLFVRGIPEPEPVAPSSTAPSAMLSDEQVEKLIDDGLRVGRNEACPCGSGRKFKHLPRPLRVVPSCADDTPRRQHALGGPLLSRTAWIAHQHIAPLNTPERATVRDRCVTETSLVLERFF